MMKTKKQIADEAKGLADELAAYRAPDAFPVNTLRKLALMIKDLATVPNAPSRRRK